MTPLMLMSTQKNTIKMLSNNDLSLVIGQYIWIYIFTKGFLISLQTPIKKTKKTVTWKQINNQRT